MTDNMIGFAAVVLSCGIPIAAIYAWYRIHQLRTNERLAAIARGVSSAVRAGVASSGALAPLGILLVAVGVGYSLTFTLLAKFESDAIEAAVFGIIPVAIGIGFFIDAYLVRRELRTSA